MRAIDELKKLHEISCDIVAIARDKNGLVFFYYNSIPDKCLTNGTWNNADSEYVEEFEKIEFDSDNWEECIITIHDFEDYEIKMMSISISEYNRLLECEKKLKQIESFFNQ